MTGAQFLQRSSGPLLAYHRHFPQGAGMALPIVMFLPGFRSDMNGTKATFLDQQCHARGQGFIRFDYSGHGQSAGRFIDGTIESWRDDALAVLDRLTDGPVLLVGSSMGGWIGLLLALARPERVRGFIGIAAAPDFTRVMADQSFDDTMWESYNTRGFAEMPNDYSSEPYIITKTMVESGNRVCLLGQVHTLRIPMRLIQGHMDKEVDPNTPRAIVDCFTTTDVQIDMVNDGDHSLSRPQDLELIDFRVMELNRLLATV